MTATNTPKPAKDGNITAFNLGMAAESVSGYVTQKTYLGSPSTEALVEPAQDGTDGAGITPPAGGVGIRGWLSGIFNKLNASIAVTGTFFQATQPVSAASLPLPAGAATSANQPTAAAQGSTTSGQTGTLIEGAVTTSAPAYTTAQTSPISLNTSGGLRVDGSAVTQPVSAASLPLPAGAATAAKQPAPGTAGTASADVITVQGKAGMTPVVVDASATSIQGGTVGSTPPTGANNVMIGVKDSSGNVAQLALDQGGALNAGFDGLQVSPASVTSAATIFTQDMTGYQGIAVQVTSAGTTCTITYETSDDNITYFQSAGMVSNYASAFDTFTQSTGTQIGTFPRRGRYFRARVSTYTSGTVTVIYTLLKSNQVYPLGSIAAVGRTASGAATFGNPVAMGFNARTSNQLVANQQIVYGSSTLTGAQIVYPFSIPELTWQFNAASGGIINTTTAVTLVAAAGAGVRNYCRSLSLHTNGTNAAGEIAIRDGAAGTVIWRGVMTANQANNMSPITFDPPLRGSANTLMEFVTLTAGGALSALYVNAQGFQAP